MFFSEFTYIIFSNFIYPFFCKFFKNKSNVTNEVIKVNNNEFCLLVGHDEESNINVYIPEKGLYQNVLITGTIGTGKTSSAMYPFTSQVLSYSSDNFDKKIATLILDVKGNYHFYVKDIIKKLNRQEDLIVIELNSNICYNPLHKPNLKAQVLANRLTTILSLFSENNSDSYWIDKVEQILTECIKLCRLYNDGYVTFKEIHNLVTVPNYYHEKINVLRNNFVLNKFSKNQVYDLLSALEFFEKEFNSLDARTLAILKSEITRITNCFISDYDVLNTFSPDKKEKLTFLGFEEVISSGKIVVLNMNISEYRNLSKIIAAYLKMDFQSEILNSLSNGGAKRITAFICDEYSEYVTKTDADFFSQSREAKCINIVSTQSYSSLENTLKNRSTLQVLLQNLINKFWFRTDDIFTVEEAQKQLGKEDKEKISKSISENAKETNFNYFTNSLNSKDSSLSESINTYTQTDFVYDTSYFTQNLETFSCVSFLSDGYKIMKPIKIKMFPYFK